MKLPFLIISFIGTFLASAKPASPPNVLFILVDDLRPSLGVYGYPDVQSPHMDRLAKQGVIFERAYCNIPVCGASRASMLTGILPTQQRFRTFKSIAKEDTPKAKTLPQVFLEAGYTTLSFGKVFHPGDHAGMPHWSEQAWRPKQSFATNLDPSTIAKLSKRGRGRIYEYPDVPDDSYSDSKIAAETIQVLRKFAKSDNPFFIATGFVRPHLPFYAPKKYWDLYQRDQLQIAENQFRPKDAPPALRGSGEYNSYHHGTYTVNSEAWHRMMRHGYLACVSYVDTLIGDILDEVEKLDLTENTIIVLWGDHGFHLGEHNFWGKHNTMSPSLQVPLIIKVPGKTGHSKALVETVDIFPTLCELAGLTIPEQCHGQSLVPVLNDPSKSFRDYVYTRFMSADAVVTEHYLYAEFSGKSGGVMLYDLQQDPHENVNQAKNPKYAKLVKSLKAKLEQAKKRATSYKEK